MSLKGVLKLLRPKNAVMSSIGVLVGWLTVKVQLSSELILAALVPPLVLMGGNAINDYFDAPIDRINRPNRPIPSGLISPQKAKRLYYIMSILGIALSIPLGTHEVLIAALFSIALYLYAWKLKGLGLPGNIIVSLGVAFTLIFGALAAGNLNTKVILFSLIAFTSNLAREIVKTVEDLEGDSIYGLRTVAIRYGVRKAGQVAALLSLLSVFISLIPLPLGMVGTAYLFLSILLASPILLMVFIKSLRISKDNAGNLSSLLKLAMFVGMLGMLLDPIVGA